jgi:hypothetical protein
MQTWKWESDVFGSSNRGTFGKGSKMLPLIGLLAAAATSIGGYTLYWYSNLSRPEQEEADRMAYDTARELYDKGLDELSADQFRRVQEVVKSRLLA